MTFKDYAIDFFVAVLIFMVLFLLYSAIAVAKRWTLP